MSNWSNSFMANFKTGNFFFFFRFSFKFLFWISPWFSFGPYEWRWPIHLRNPLVCGVKKKSFERPCANWTSKTRGLGQGAGGPVLKFLESWDKVLDVCGPLSHQFWNFEKYRISDLTKGHIGHSQFYILFIMTGLGPMFYQVSCFFYCKLLLPAGTTVLMSDMLLLIFCVFVSSYSYGLFLTSTQMFQHFFILHLFILIIITTHPKY